VASWLRALDAAAKALSAADRCRVFRAEEVKVLRLRLGDERRWLAQLALRAPD